MIAVDTSSLVAFFQGDNANDVYTLRTAITNNALVIPPIVLSEILSAKNISQDIENVMVQLPLIEITDGFWQRLGKTRQTLITKKLKARTADAFIAQCCIDHNIPLITRDSDFRHYQKYCKLDVIGN